MFLLILIMLSCGMGKREARESVQNGNFKVEFLFEQDGCKMYRFYDGRTIYWANCAGKVSYDEDSGYGKARTTDHVEAIITNSHDTKRATRNAKNHNTDQESRGAR